VCWCTPPPCQPGLDHTYPYCTCLCSLTAGPGGLVRVSFFQAFVGCCHRCILFQTTEALCWSWCHQYDMISFVSEAQRRTVSLFVFWCTPPTCQPHTSLLLVSAHLSRACLLMAHWWCHQSMQASHLVAVSSYGILSVGFVSVLACLRNDCAFIVMSCCGAVHASPCRTAHACHSVPGSACFGKV
jgi:hypothetical protein